MIYWFWWYAGWSNPTTLFSDGRHATKRGCASSFDWNVPQHGIDARFGTNMLTFVRNVVLEVNSDTDSNIFLHFVIALDRTYYSPLDL